MPEKCQVDVSKYETSLPALIAANADFFKMIASSEFKSGHLHHLIKNSLIGNKLRAFADQKQAMTDKFREPRLAAIASTIASIMDESSLQKEERSLLVKANFNQECVFKQKTVLEIGCHIGTVALQIAAMHDPKVVIAVDIDPSIISAAINHMHKVINDEECASVIKEQL